MHLDLPKTNGKLEKYPMTGAPIAATRIPADAARVVYSAAHVVRDPFAEATASGLAAIDWDSTMVFREHLIGLGLGIAEAMDTAQRGMGLDWAGALELIRQTKTSFPDALVVNGCGTDHLNLSDKLSLADVRDAYLEQVEAIQQAGGRIILMASRALARVATGPQDYISVYTDVLAACDSPVILHWLGEMFDPQLAGYWGGQSFDETMLTALHIIDTNQHKIDGIKISLLDASKEIQMRRKLPATVRMYTGDDFNYPELIKGDEQGFSHALLGIFDPLAHHAAAAVAALSKGDNEQFDSILNSTVPLARHIFKAPTQHYKTGVVFLAWLNGYQKHFKMLAGSEAMRSLPYFVDCFKMADQCGALRDPNLALSRMHQLLAVYGISK